MGCSGTCRTEPVVGENIYQLHPSAELCRHFRDRPYQGAAPCDAEFLFVGLDANYAADIALRPVFAQVLDYHRDGVGFWQRQGVHHPFLLPQYRGGGRRYHRNFARLGFLPQEAAQVSFVELLHVPTVGRSNLVVADLDLDHLRMIDTAMRSGRAHHVFMPGVHAGHRRARAARNPAVFLAACAPERR
ncbi:hypothetical protein J7373_09255 [Xanthomonas sp. A2111]|uniref:Uncharacterized protein n=1 Tax=Xanthomonas hawaiiensis TaxID=3003247 RepID=A0ABU2I4U5_9XANT|nr:hypothetical protein [Xanthomonas sp. A2111]MBO9828432.1 hypothetical protein [Xanthomonas sp. A2111]MDS9993179.1 hypothetical protein [Xanthomonas sp. A2111]